MPVTPFHLGPALFLSGLFRKNLDLIAVSIGAVIPDLEAFINLINGKPIHGFSHTYVGASFYALFAAFLLILFLKKFKGLNYANSSNKKIFISSLVGAWSHIFLDSFLYPEMKPFWPISPNNPFLNMGITYEAAVNICIAAAIIGIAIYGWYYFKEK